MSQERWWCLALREYTQVLHRQVVLLPELWGASRKGTAGKGVSSTRWGGRSNRGAASRSICVMDLVKEEGGIATTLVISQNLRAQ